MNKATRIIFFPLIFCGFFTSAQNLYLKNADRLFENYAYYEASIIYLSYLQQQYDYNSNYKLAECYRMMNDMKQAEHWYTILMEQPVSNPLLYKNYADVLRQNGKYDEAKDNYLKYAVFFNDGYYYAGMCDWAAANMRNRSAYLIDTIGVNTRGSDICATFFKQGIIYATNGIPPTGETYKWTGTAFYDLYYAELESNSVVRKSPLDPEVNSKAHDASASYSSVSKSLYFTRNSFYKNRSRLAKDGDIKLQLYQSFYSDGYFTRARPMEINNRSSSSGQPAISPDGRILIFASDRPGGFGGTDLYYSVKTEIGWTNPKNLGQIINTPGNEMFPFISDDGKLYFSSDYHLGFGGLDVFSSERVNDHWSDPKNLGLPVNSSRDDFGFIIRNGKGFISSNREGGKGNDDIYTITELNTVTGIIVHDPDNKGISGAKIYYFENGQLQFLNVTDGYGYCDLSALVGKDITLKITKEGFLETTTKNLNTIKTNNGTYPIELQPLIGEQERQPDKPVTPPATTGGN